MRRRVIMYQESLLQMMKGNGGNISEHEVHGRASRMVDFESTQKTEKKRESPSRTHILTMPNVCLDLRSPSAKQ